ncbi:uncharacterized protein LOC122260327 isoform X2 [Penaeus japonicus]|nr:uncharacterized protein LOC122260327 isoform X2 [Penaeus japonicus]
MDSKETSETQTVQPGMELKEPEASSSVVETCSATSPSGLSKYSLLLKVLKGREQRRGGSIKDTQTSENKYADHESQDNHQIPHKQKMESKRYELSKLRDGTPNATRTTYIPDGTPKDDTNVPEVKKSVLSLGTEDDWESDEETQNLVSHNQIQGEFCDNDNYDKGKYDSDFKNSSVMTSVKSHRATHQSNPFGRILDKFDIFSCRIKVSAYAKTISGELEEASKPLSDLEKCLLDIKSSSSHSELMEKIFSFTKCIEENNGLASVFLLNFTQYISSQLVLENNLIELSGFVVCLIPCIEAAVKVHIPQDVISEIKNQNLIQRLLISTATLFKEEAKYKESSIKAVMEYGKDKNPAKAHITRMKTEDSKTLFQETFGDIGPQADLYTIYFWYIINICEIEIKDGNQSSMISMTKDLETSGKFMNILPMCELRSRESKLPSLNERQKIQQHSDPKVTQVSDSTTTPATSTTTSTCISNSTATTITTSSSFIHATANESRFQWVEFRLGQLYENGVTFLVNMQNWQEKLQEVSRSVQSLEVKKQVKFSPSLGSTFAIFLQGGIKTLTGKVNITYIRVRVVRVMGPVVCVYGIDTGTSHTCGTIDLILLPANILSHPPAGRLALLPVTPTPDASSITPNLALVLALVRHSDLALDLQGVDIRPLGKWLQCDDLVPLTLQLLQAVANISQNADRLCDICSILTNYMEHRVCRKNSHDFPFDENLPKLLISVMHNSLKARLTAAKNGAFRLLYEIGLQTGSESVWEALKTLLGGKEILERWSQLSWKVSRLGANSKPDSRKVTSIGDKEHHQQADPSMSIMRVAEMASDRNWDLEIRSSIRTRQLMTHQELKEGWHWDGQEVLAANVGVLCSGHVLNVTNDETHHIILDKSIPNIRMNTILQIILGMLNTGLGGKIYIGLNSQGIVQGAKMSRDHRDCFMLGFSKLVTSEIYPMLMPCNSLIQFIPVVRSGMTSTGLPPVSSSQSTTLPSDSSGFVIIMIVRPQPNTIYRCRDDPEALLMREGGVNTFVRGQKAAQLMNTCAMWVKELQEEVAKEKQLMLNTILSEDKLV